MNGIFVQTDIEPIRIIPDDGADDQLLYFTSSSLTADDHHLIFIREESGQPNLWVMDLNESAARRLTDHDDGVLRSYVYFSGQPFGGFGKASVSLDVQRGLAYYLHGREVRVVDLRGQGRAVASLRDDEVTAFTHVSVDGRLLCIPTTDARALEGYPGYNIDERIQRENLSSYLNIFDTRSGELLARERVHRGWVTHVQFSPSDSKLILYNHEWPGQCGRRRIWLWDGSVHRALRSLSKGRSEDDWVSHEMWSRDGRHVVYHGRYGADRPFVGRMDLSGQATEIVLPTGSNRYGHFTVSNDDRLVTDGYFDAPGDDVMEKGGWISLVVPDWHASTVRFNTLCRTHSSWQSQDAHPHPIFNHRADWIYFTSDRDGRRSIYRIDWNQSTEASC